MLRLYLMRVTTSQRQLRKKRRICQYGTCRYALVYNPNRNTIITVRPDSGMVLKSTCRGICKQYRVKKPPIGGRYQAGQARCQTCDIWIDSRGAHLLDGEPAADEFMGWFCNCCNYRVRRNPRNIKYKTRIRNSQQQQATAQPASDEGKSSGRKSGRRDHPIDVDLTYFNKRRAQMLRELGSVIVQVGWDNHSRLRDDLSYPSGLTTRDIAIEFGIKFEDVLKLAASEEPNKISLIVDFERVKNKVDHTPTKQDVTRHSHFGLSDYRREFKSWQHFLERLGYDPWYRN